jgi:hypothetical protein
MSPNERAVRRRRERGADYSRLPSLLNPAGINAFATGGADHVLDDTTTGDPSVYS